MFIATIDAGTTNTRTRIWQSNRIISEASAPVGVRNTAIDGNNAKLTMTIHDTLQMAAQKIDRAVKDIDLVLATGMLTSNVGLMEIPHITAPVDFTALAAAMVSHDIERICPQPIWFVPGIKNFDAAILTAEQMSGMDIMRGEEVEACGVMERMNIQGAAVLILPGSHNKYIAVDDSHKIAGCMTTIAGELLHSLTFDTILADAVQRSFAEKFNQTAFARGVEYSQKLGLGRAAFMTRIFNQFKNYTSQEAQNYLLGLVLSDDLYSLQHSALFAQYTSASVIVAGKPVMQAAYQYLLDKEGLQVTLLSAKMQEGLSGFGAIALAKRRGLV